MEVCQSCEDANLLKCSTAFADEMAALTQSSSQLKVITHRIWSYVSATLCAVPREDQSLLVSTDAEVSQRRSSLALSPAKARRSAMYESRESINEHFACFYVSTLISGANRNIMGKYTHADLLLQ